MKGKHKRLVFHFFLPPNWRELKSVRLHLNCLKHYSFIFDEAIFILSVDDVKDTKLIQEFEAELLTLGFQGDIIFKVRENTILYEAKTLNEEIVEKLETLDGMTFFGHSKGIGNELQDVIEWDELAVWICGLYFLSLEYYLEAQAKLYGVWSIVFGPFKSTWAELDNKYHWIYSGTFFWINCPRLYDKIQRENLTVRHCCDRFFSEHFLGDLLEMKRQTAYSNIVSSHKESYLINSTDYYDQVSYYITLILGGRDLEDFNNFKQNMLSNIK